LRQALTHVEIEAERRNRLCSALLGLHEVEGRNAAKLNLAHPLITCQQC